MLNAYSMLLRFCLHGNGTESPAQRQSDERVLTVQEVNFYGVNHTDNFDSSFSWRRPEMGV